METRQGLKDGNAPAILLEDVRDGIVRESIASAETGTFIHITGAASRKIVLRGNHVGKAKKEITFGGKNVSKAVVKQ